MNEYPKRKGKYALTAPTGAFFWWEINDLEKMYAVVTIQSDFPNAERIINLAWDAISVV